MNDALEPLSCLHIPVWIFDVEHCCIAWANSRGLEFWGATSLDELTHRDMSLGMSASVHKRLQQYLEDCTLQGQSYNEHWTVYPNDEPQTAEVVFSPFTLSDGRHALLIHLLYENKEEESGTLHSTQALLHTSAMISLYTEDFELLYSNPAARSVAIRESMPFYEQLVDSSNLDKICKALDQQGFYEIECLVNTQQGRVWHAMSIQVSIDSVSGGKSLLVSATDITARRKAQEEAICQAAMDSLTGLLNRTALLDNMTDQIEHCRINSGKVAIIFLDLDRFKLVNDTLGHLVGDELLKACARRLRQCVSSGDIVARQGGDEFVVMLTNLTDREMAKQIADRIYQKVSNPVVVSGHKLRITPSMGVSFFPDDGTDTTTLMQHADLAMYAAKESDDGIQLYDAKMGEKIKYRLALENDLANAIDEEQFELHYQPKIGTAGGEITGVEALIRWVHPQRGMVSPDDFIPIAEETGMIIQIGQWITQQAIRDQNIWHDQGFDIPVSINISPKQFLSADFSDDVKQALELSRCELGCLELEITESVLIIDQAQILTIMHELNEVGVRFSLDDFGTGYSNLAYLQKYPLDCLKIDRAFLKDIEETALLELILGMGKIMGLRVVAEGVETEEQIRWLHAHGCDELQGYYFSKPRPLASWLEFIADYNPLNQKTNLAA